MKEGTKRIYFLDELRGFAIICMVIHHMFYDFGFVLGFIPAAYIAGIGVREGQPLYQSIIYTYLAILVTFIFGALYFVLVMNVLIGTPVGFIEALMITVLPFAIKDLIVGTLTVMFARVLKARGILKIAH